MVSFDIFDTCLLRKCGTPLNFYDVLSYRVFSQEVGKDVRKDFAVARKKAEDKVWRENPRLCLEDIYSALKFDNPALRSKKELVEIEMDLEFSMLVPSLKAKSLIKESRRRGDRVIFISDMYLPHDFVQDVLERYGLYEEGDGLYISNEFGLTKQSGELFKAIMGIEKTRPRKWKHYGDDLCNDVSVPRALGIEAEQFLSEYLPYSDSWRHSLVSLFNYPSILAGVSRASYYSQADDSHKAFVLDLIAPFYCSFAYNILQDAQKRGINRLYFCSRDTYQLYGVVKRFEPLFPTIEIKYLYISRASLYNGETAAKQQYFQQEGLAMTNDSVAIVDITTSGKTIAELNRFLVEKGYKKVFGYFFMLWDDAREIPVEKEWCHFELEVARVRSEARFNSLLSHLFVFENYFALNSQARTVDYKVSNGVAYPVFDAGLTEIETVHEDIEYWSRRHEELLAVFADMYIDCGLFRYSDEILNGISLSTLCSFFDVPEAKYLPALEQYRVYSSESNSHIPYVRKSSLPHLMITRGKDSSWSRATIMNSAPKRFCPILQWWYFSKHERV